MFWNKTKVYGKISHIRAGIADVKLHVEVRKSDIARVFTGNVELEKLHNKGVALVIDRIDTKREELRRYQKEKAERERKIAELAAETEHKIRDKKVK